MTVELEQAWRRILTWLDAEAPHTATAVRAPADEQVLLEAQETTGGRWPADVVAFYRLCDGAERTPEGYLLPGFRPMPLLHGSTLESVVGTWRWNYDQLTADAQQWAATPPDPRETNLRVMAGLDPVAPNPYDPARAESELAGTVTGMPIPSWLPIAEDQSGSTMVVDRRDGPEHGCVLSCDKVDLDHQAGRWSSLTALLAGIADAMTTGDAVPGTRLRPAGEHGVLTWQRIRRA